MSMYERFACDWLMETRFLMRQPQSYSVIKNVTDGATPEQIMEEFRREHPEEAMLLGEWIVLEDEDTGAGAP